MDCNRRTHDSFTNTKMMHIIRPIAGSKTEERGKKAAAQVSAEIRELCDVIFDCGTKNKDGTAIITFGRLFQVYNVISDKCVGLLMRARKHGLVEFEGEMLFQRRDDEVLITLTKSINAIRHQFGAPPLKNGGSLLEAENGDILQNQSNKHLVVNSDSKQYAESAPVTPEPENRIVLSLRALSEPLENSRDKDENQYHRNSNVYSNDVSSEKTTATNREDSLTGTFNGRTDPTSPQDCGEYEENQENIYTDTIEKSRKQSLEAAKFERRSSASQISIIVTEDEQTKYMENCCAQNESLEVPSSVTQFPSENIDGITHQKGEVNSEDLETLADEMLNSSAGDQNLASVIINLNSDLNYESNLSYDLNEPSNRQEAYQLKHPVHENNSTDTAERKENIDHQEELCFKDRHIEYKQEPSELDNDSSEFCKVQDDNIECKNKLSRVI
ncbi:uncharacterized protein LOC136027227 isoform X2 [Artemia franciscana]|uniref:Costars domain-containing protein n=1 Tax=Artemia franciscana TaxID=6661 RepID=A0AA88HME6_ARTSF|nr:hypothetical protein QYM36_013418 [Artemia franciscana]KAK2709734.1 hypothetical protein QYM36_013418 [Artemia franciscana]